MKLVLTTIALASTLTLVGCNKTKKVTAAHVSPPASDVDVEVDENQLVLAVGEEERSIDLSGILGGINLDDIGGEMKIEVMVIGDESDIDGQWLVNLDNMEGKHEIRMIVNGEEMEGLPDGIMEHIMGMMGGENHGEMEASFGWTTGAPPHGQMRMTRMGGEDGFDNHEIREHMMRGKGGHENHMRRQWEEHGDMEGGPQGEWQMHEREIPEEHQFMEELGMFNAVAAHLRENEAVAIMGIHMIRDQLVGELRLESLEAIIDGAEEGSPERNAALLVAIETLQEGGDSDRAADFMVELVLSN